MVKYCPECGAEIKEGSKFCINCGAKIEENNSIADKPTLGETIVSPHFQPQVDLSGKSLGKPRNKIIAALLVIAVVVIVIVVVLSGVFLDDKSKFLGTWRDIEHDETLTFYEDGTLHISSQSSGFFGTGYSATCNWEIVDGNFILSNDYVSVSLKYEFSDFNRRLKLYSLEDYKTVNLVKVS